jgi:hypothetical protein
VPSPTAVLRIAGRDDPTKFGAVAKLLATLVFLGLMSLPALAFAGPNDNSSSRPWTVDIGMGPAVNLEGGYALGKAGLDAHYHFKGGDVGPALGGLFYMHFRGGVFGFNLGPMFLWDFRVYEKNKVKLYLAPLVALGYSLTNYHGGYVGDTDHHFFMDFGGQFKTVWNDRAGVFIRPLNFSLIAGKGGATGFWTLIAGLTLSF